MKKSIAKKAKPVKRYVQKKDSIGRTYTVDKKTGKRVANAKAKAKPRKAPKSKVAELKSKLKAAETRAAKAETKVKEAEAREYERAEREALAAEAAERAEFVELHEIPGFMQTTAIRAEKYPKVGMALDHAVGLAATEFLGIQRKIAEGYEPTDDELVRARLLTSHLGQDEQYDNIDDAAHGLAEEYDMEVREIYELFYSPEAV